MPISPTTLTIVALYPSINLIKIYENQLKTAFFRYLRCRVVTVKGSISYIGQFFQYNLQNSHDKL